MALSTPSISRLLICNFFLLACAQGAIAGSPISLGFKTRSQTVIDCSALLGASDSESRPQVAQNGLQYLQRIYRDEYRTNARTVDQSFFHESASLLTNVQWESFIDILESMGKTHVADSVHIMLDSGGSISVGNYEKKTMVEMLPSLTKSARTLGMTGDQLLKVIKAFVGTRSEISGLAGDEKCFPKMFEEAAKGPIKLGASQVDELISLIDLSKKEGLLANAIYNIGYLLRLGLRVDQIQDIFNELYKGNRVYAGLHAFQRLQAMTKLLIDFHADPNQVHLAFTALFRHIEKHWTNFSSLLDVMILAIERRALTDGNSANEVLHQLEVTANRNVKALDRLLPEHTEEPARVMNTAIVEPVGIEQASRVKTDLVKPNFPLVQRRLRPSRFSYMTRLSYEEGMSHLLELAKDQTVTDEGAFVFDPDTNTWYSLATETTILWGEGRVRTNFEDIDLSQFGTRPKFIHIHPKSLTTLLVPPREFTDNYRYLLGNFASTMPSRADLEIFSHFITDAARTITPEFVIVHGYGTTVINLNQSSGERFRQFVSSFQTWKDSVMRDFLREMQTSDLADENDAERLLQVLWRKAQDRLNRQF